MAKISGCRALDSLNDFSLGGIKFSEDIHTYI
jgi:hypothetical protein